MKPIPSDHPSVAWSSVVLLAIMWIYLGFGSIPAVREILGVPLVLLVPGGLLVMMLPRRPGDPFFRLALAVGLSIAMCIIVGLLLDVIPSGIDRQSWACALGLISVTESVVIVTRRSRANGDLGSFRPGMLTRADTRTAVVAVVMTLATLGGLIAIVAWERSNAEASYRQERFAELWVDPASGEDALIGVHSDFSGTERFRLSVSAAGQLTRSYSCTLGWQQTWRQRISIAPGGARVRISLFAGSTSHPSDRVWYVPSPGA
jgi:Protein of unknown function (DUF1616)